MDPVADVYQVVGSIGIGSKVSDDIHTVVRTFVTDGGVESALAQLWFTLTVHGIEIVVLECHDHPDHHVVSTLKPLWRYEIHVVGRGVILWITRI